MTNHILVVDDSAVDRQRIGFLLSEQMPAAVVTFSENGRIAMDSLATFTPDVIISDMRMPELNGLDLVKRLRSSNRMIPVVLMTRFGNEKIAVKALSAGAASYVPKNELEKELVPTLNNVLEVSKLRQKKRRVFDNLTSAEYRYSVECDAATASAVISHILDQIATMRLLSPQQMTRVGVALQESISNAVYHGNLELDSELRQENEAKYYKLADQRRQLAPYRDRRVRMIASLSRQNLWFTVNDEGPGFDYKSHMNAAAEINLDRIGGRGLLLIRSFMDQVNFNLRGNEITMVMRAQTPEAEADETINKNHKTETDRIDSLLSLPRTSSLVLA